MNKKGFQMTWQVILGLVVMTIVLGWLLWFFFGQVEGPAGSLFECKGECREACLSDEKKMPGECEALEDETEQICCGKSFS